MMDDCFDAKSASFNEMPSVFLRFNAHYPLLG